MKHLAHRAEVSLSFLCVPKARNAQQLSSTPHCSVRHLFMSPAIVSSKHISRKFIVCHLHEVSLTFLTVECFVSQILGSKQIFVSTIAGMGGHKCSNGSGAAAQCYFPLFGHFPHCKAHRCQIQKLFLHRESQNVNFQGVTSKHK